MTTEKIALLRIQFKSWPDIQELFDALEAAQRDSERLDWLEVYILKGWDINATTWFTRALLQGLREAIDAARAAMKGDKSE